MKSANGHAIRTVNSAGPAMIEPVLDRRLEDLNHLAKLLTEESFKTEQKQIKSSIAMGYDFDEACFSINIATQRQRCRFHKMALGLATYTPEALMLSYRQRSRARYSMFMDLMNRAKSANDRKTETQCILAMCKLDASEAQLAQALGLVQLTKIEGDDGVTGNDPTEYERKIRELERRINSSIEDVRSAIEPITIDIQSESNPRGEADRVDTDAVSQDSVTRQV